ncbi:MAG: hypothetical protein ACOCV8_05220, partial [Spirochaetota bacterium]
MNKSDYTPIAMRGGIGDILLYTLKVWGNGFWKYFFISFLFLIPLFLSINLFNIIVLPNITGTEEVADSIAESSENTEEITNEISASNKSKIDINSNILFYVYTTISILIITYFLCLSIGANSYITGKYSVGEDTSINDALAYSFKRTGSYLTY